MTITIRFMSKSDIPTISQLLAISFQNKFSPAAKLSVSQLRTCFTALLYKNYSFECQSRLVICVNDRLAGSVGFKYQPTSIFSAMTSFPWPLRKHISLFCLLRFFILLQILDHTLEKKECYISDFAISPDYQKQGIGHKLLNYAQNEFVSQHNCERLSLHVASSNQRAFHLYEKCGFKVVQQSSISWISKKLFHEPIWNYMTWYPSINFSKELNQ